MPPWLGGTAYPLCREPTVRAVFSRSYSYSISGWAGSVKKEKSRVQLRNQVDLFILHSEADDSWVAHWLIPKLSEAGISTATREDFRIGRTVALNYEEAVERSRYVAFVLSPEGLEDRWAAFAASLALHR